LRGGKGERREEKEQMDARLPSSLLLPICCCRRIRWRRESLDAAVVAAFLSAFGWDYGRAFQFFLPPSFLWGFDLRW